MWCSWGRGRARGLETRMGVSSGSDKVGLGLGWGQIIVRWSPELYWKFSPALQGYSLQGVGEVWQRGDGRDAGIRGGG